MTAHRKRLFHIAVTCIFITVGAGLMVTLTASKSHLKKTKPSIPIPLARVLRVEMEPQSISIHGEGTVRPLREIHLVPQVGGKVLYISPALVDGGEFKKGDILLKIDPIDYELAVTLAQAKVKDAESKLSITQEEATVAKEEWRYHRAGNSHTQREAPPLVAKEPQLAAARAQLEADRANLQKAVLNLERTVLKAPFDGRVSDKNVDVGQYVAPGQTLATTYSTEAAEISVPLEDKTLFWFNVPGFTPDDGPGAVATVSANIAGRQLSWSGRIVRTEGTLDEKTRMIRVIVRVDAPYARKPPLVVGLFVTVEINGHVVPDAVLIPRGALHQDNIVWVVDGDGILRFRQVEVAYHQGKGAIISSGLNNGDMVVISTLRAVTDGMRVRTALVEEQ